ncbi:hypothetical protein JG688_00005825 [Phytophthora aleatoria]|uniref:Uncharacterized protein n=1 Tax=Phytophthora aleatoria TaxID=2496075 RepID=A0A8J5J1P1_9STRA|nr:hypothetical protein JG688_00005825 [Phytophthora aleatoria]
MVVGYAWEEMFKTGVLQVTFLELPEGAVVKPGQQSLHSMETRRLEQFFDLDDDLLQADDEEKAYLNSSNARKRAREESSQEAKGQAESRLKALRIRMEDDPEMIATSISLLPRVRQIYKKEVQVPCGRSRMGIEIAVQAKLTAAGCSRSTC